MRPDYMILYKKTANAPYCQDYIFGEIAARAEANRLWKDGAVYIELLKRDLPRRGGFVRVKIVTR